MNMKRPITIISSISSLLFLVAIIWFGVGIYIDKKTGNDKATLRFEKLLNETRNNLIEASSSQNLQANAKFSNQFIRSIGNIDDFSTLKLEINGELIYSYPPTVFSLPSPDLVKHFEEEVSINSNNYFKLSAAIYLMKPTSIYNYAKIAFLLILIGTIIVVVLIVLTNGTDGEILQIKRTAYPNTYRPFAEKTSSAKKADSKRMIDEYEEDEEEDDPENQNALEILPEKKPVAKTEPKIENQEEKKEKETKPIYNPEKAGIFREIALSDEEVDGLDIIEQLEKDNEENSDFFAEDSVPQVQAEENDWKEADGQTAQKPIQDDFTAENVQTDESEEKIPASQKNASTVEADGSSEENSFVPDYLPEEEKKNVSAVTDLFVQSELLPDIDTEISLGKENLTVALLKVNSLDRGNTISTQIVSILKARTASENPKIFEYKSDSYAIVLRDSDLQRTVDKFEEVYNAISDFLKDSNATNEVSVGISSVTSRKIKADRLVLEASQALDYASQDPDSPIVAFRANPEKYRQYQEN